MAAPTPETVLQELRTHAEHLAAIKMFYAAAGVFRDYRGPLAAETQAEREKLALDYEHQGALAEHHRQSHVTTLPPSPAITAPPASSAPHCPNCRRDLPMAFVICPYCGLDFRTGKLFSPPSAAAPPSGPRPLHAKHRQSPTLNPWAVIAIALAVLLAVNLISQCSTPAKPKHRQIVPPPFTH